MTDLTWKPADSTFSGQVARSADTVALSHDQWPKWAQNAQQVQRVWLWCPEASSVFSSAGTTAPVVGRMLTERLDPKDVEPFNYNFYFLVQSSDGRLWQSSPIRMVDFGHHLPEPPDLLSGYPYAVRKDA